MEHRHHSHHHHHRRRKGWIWLSLLLVCTLAVFGITYVLEEMEKGNDLGDLGLRFHSKIQLERDGQTYYYRENEIVNILMIGIDETSIDGVHTDFRGGGQADYLLLLAIDRANKRITPIQIDRDTKTEIDVTGCFGDPAGTRYTQICLAHDFGKTPDDRCRNVAAAVSRLFGGIPIHYYIALDLSTIDVFNSALGGVDVTIQEDMTNIDPAFQVGATVHLQGNQAEKFVRSRMAVKSDPTNAGRMRRQRAYMMAAIDKLSSMVESDAAFLVHFMENTQGHMITDLPIGWLTDHAQTYNRFERAEIWEPKGKRKYSSDGFAEFYPNEKRQTDMLIHVFFDA